MIEDLDLYRAGRPKEGAAPPSEAIRPPADAIRMIAVPTTLSAAEFNAYAGISDPRHGIKESFGHRLIVPRVIVLDPAATLATPMDLMLSTGLKAVDHAVERLCSQQAHPFVLGTATEALKLLAARCPAHKATPEDMETRLDLQFGMWLSIGAGTSGVGVGASHGIGHVLGAACHVPHGHTSCVMLPSVLRWNLPANAERQKRVSEAFGKPAYARGRSRGGAGEGARPAGPAVRGRRRQGPLSARSPRSRCTTAPCSTIRGRSRARPRSWRSSNWRHEVTHEIFSWRAGFSRAWPTTIFGSTRSEPQCGDAMTSVQVATPTDPWRPRPGSRRRSTISPISASSR